jgi:hypothetical protein
LNRAWDFEIFLSLKQASLASIRLVNQGDQIGRIFARWAIIYHRQFFEFTKVAQILGQLLSPVKAVYQLQQIYGLGNFSINSSGHHACFRQRQCVHQPGYLFPGKSSLTSNLFFSRMGLATFFVTFHKLIWSS